jgi:hypothetical protein
MKVKLMIMKSKIPKHKKRTKRKIKKNLIEGRKRKQK